MDNKKYCTNKSTFPMNENEINITHASIKYSGLNLNIAFETDYMAL